MYCHKYQIDTTSSSCMLFTVLEIRGILLFCAKWDVYLEYMACCMSCVFPMSWSALQFEVDFTWYNFSFQEHSILPTRSASSACSIFQNICHSLLPTQFLNEVFPADKFRCQRMAYCAQTNETAIIRVRRHQHPTSCDVGGCCCCCCCYYLCAHAIGRRILVKPICWRDWKRCDARPLDNGEIRDPTQVTAAGPKSCLTAGRGDGGWGAVTRRFVRSGVTSFGWEEWRHGLCYRVHCLWRPLCLVTWLVYTGGRH